MASAKLFEKLEKEHKDLLEKIDDLDRKITEALNEWGKTPELIDLGEEANDPLLNENSKG